MTTLHRVKVKLTAPCHIYNQKKKKNLRPESGFVLTPYLARMYWAMAPDSTSHVPPSSRAGMARNALLSCLPPNPIPGFDYQNSIIKFGGSKITYPQKLSDCGIRCSPAESTDSSRLICSRVCPIRMPARACALHGKCAHMNTCTELCTCAHAQTRVCVAYAKGCMCTSFKMQSLTVTAEKQGDSREPAVLVMLVKCNTITLEKCTRHHVRKHASNL